MRRLASILGFLLLEGCGSVRVIEHTESFAESISHLPQDEVVRNLNDTVDDPYRIARRSTFGKATLLSSDNAQASVAIPLHLFATTPGSVNGNVGNLLDTYSIDVSPESDGVTLGVLRQAYQAAVYPDLYPAAATNLASFIGSRDRKWLFWKNADGSPACLHGTTYCSEAEPDMLPVARGPSHVFYVRDPELYAKFTLLTFGKSAETNRVSGNESPGLIVVGQQGYLHNANSARRHASPLHRAPVTAPVRGQTPVSPHPASQLPPRPLQSGDVVPPPRLKPTLKFNEFQMLQDSRRPPLSTPSITLNPQ